MSKQDNDNLEIPEFLNKEYKNQRIRETNPLEYYSNPRFFGGSRLFSECFKLFIQVGEKNCLQRNLTDAELQKMQKSYINYCEKNNYTEKDFMNTLYAYELYATELEKGRALSGKEKIYLKRDLAKEFGYKGSLFKSQKIKDIRHIPFSQDRKKSLHLSNFFSTQFAKAEMPESSDKIVYINREAKRRSIYRRNENLENLKTLYRPVFREHLTYRPPLSSNVKKGFLTLAAFSLTGLMAFSGIRAHIDTQAYKNTTIESALEAGLDYEDLGLSSSYTEDQINSTMGLSKYIEEDAPVIDLLQNGGSIALLEDISKKLELYTDTVPTVEEERLLMSEIQCLPEAIFLDKTIQAYNQAHKDDEDFKPAAAAKLRHIENLGEDFPHYYSVELYDKYGYDFNFDNLKGMRGLLGLLPTRVSDISEINENIDDLSQEMDKVHSDLAENKITEYDRVATVSDHLTSMRKYVDSMMDFAARDFVIEKTLFGDEYLEIEGHNYNKTNKDEKVNSASINNSTTNNRTPRNLEDNDDDGR